MAKKLTPDEEDEVKNKDIKQHLEKQDHALTLLEKAVNQIVEILQDSSGKIAHLYRWKERERVKQGFVSFRAANIIIRVMTVIGSLIVAAAIVYAVYKLINWLF